MIDENFECAVQVYLQKAELEYRAKNAPGATMVEWLADSCDSLEDIVHRLRSLGFRIKEIVDDRDCDGNEYQWVVTTSGVVVYKNKGTLRGLVGRRIKE